MESKLEQLKNVWATYDKKLDQHLHLNQQILREMKLEKVKSGMRGLIIMRTIEAFVFFLIIIALWSFILSNFSASSAVISAAVLTLFATVGLAGNIGQIVLAGTIDYSRPITTIQKQLEEMKLHNLRFFKLIMFSAPFYMAYIFLGFQLFFGVDLYAVADQGWLWSNLALSGGMLIAVLWFNQQLSAQHPRYGWIRRIVAEVGGKKVVKGISFLREIREFEKVD